MDEEKIQNQISDVIETTPAANKQNAAKPIEAPAGYSTLRTGLPEEMPSAPAQHFETTPSQGIGFAKETDEMITGGTAIPGLKYDTRFKTVDDEGDPLYYKPNYQPVVPYPVGSVQADTINPNKLDWSIAKNFYAARDEDYLGYYLLPENGSQSFWDFVIGGLHTFAGSLPSAVAKGATGLATSALKMPFLGAAAYQSGDYETIGPDPKLQQVLEGAGLRNKSWAPLIDRMRQVAPESDAGSFFNELMKEGPQDAVKILNRVQDWVDEAVSPLEKSAFENWDADTTDDRYMASFGRGLSSAIGSVGLAYLTQNPRLTFALLNFAQVGSMRRNALNYGVSPSWSEVYSIGAATATTLLDLFGFENLIASSSIIRLGTQSFLKSLGEKGLLNAVKRHGKRELASAGIEAATEMAQTSIEGAYDPEFREDPFTPLSIAGLSAGIIKIGAVKASIRHANAEDRMRLAEYAGVKDLLEEANTAAYKIVDDMIDKGVVDKSQREVVFNELISNAPDTVIKTMREAAQGQLDKISPEARKEFFGILQDIKNNFVGKVFDPKTMQMLDKEVDTNIADVRGSFSDSEVDIIKGIVRGVYTLSAIANANNPNYKGFQVPKIEITSSPDSSYNPKTNVLSISGTRSDTEYTGKSADFEGMVRPTFWASRAQSDKMASVLHELTHWMDTMVGRKGFGDYLEYYYNSIADVFGKDKALSVYKKSGRGSNRAPNPKETGYTDEKNATEYAANALSRLGKRAADAFGLGKSKANEFLSFANIMMNQLGELNGSKGQKLSDAIGAYQTAVQEITKANMDKLSDLIEAYGSDRIKEALARFSEDRQGFDDFAEFLANEDMLRDLYDVMDSFSDAAGIEKINDLFDGDQQAQDNFVTAGDRMFRSGYDNAVAEVRARRDAAKSQTKPVTAKADPNMVKTDAGVVDSKQSKELTIEDLEKYLKGPEFMERGASGEIQPWAQTALGAKESVMQSKEIAEEEPRQIFADKQIDGRNLTDDIDMATKGITARLKKPMNKVTKWFSSSAWGWGLDTILVNVLGRDVAEKFDVAGKYTAKQAARSKYWAEFTKRLEPIIGKQSDKAGFAYNYKTMVTDLGLTRMKGVEIVDPINPELSRVRDITGWEAMYVYLMDKQGYGNRVQKGTTTNIQDIIATLTDNEKMFADAMSEQLMSMYEKSFGKQSYKNYFPIMDAEHEMFHELSIDSLIQRRNTDDTIAITDAGRIFSQYVSRWASHESGFFQEMKRLRDVFGYRGVDKNETGPLYTFNPDEDEQRMKASASLAHGVEMAIGKQGLDNLRAIIENQLSDGQEAIFDASANSALNQAGRNIMKSLLSAKLISFPKNLANITMMWGGAKDQNLYWNSFSEGFGNMKRTFDYMMAHSKEIKQRWGGAGGINEYLDQNTLGGNTAPAMKLLQKTFGGMTWSADATTNMAKFSAAMDMMGEAGLKVFMQSGDMVANVFGGYGLIKDYMAQGLTEEQAFKKLDRYIVEHQSSSNLMMKPLIQLRNNKGFFGQIFAFTSEQVVKAASVLGKFDEVNMGTATKSEAVANALSIAISAAIYSAIAAGVWDLWSDDDKQREDAEKALINAAIDQALGGLVAGNALLSPAISYMIGDTRMGGMRVPLYEYTLDGIGALKKGEYDRVITKAMSAMGVFVGADNLWNSMLGISLLTDADPAVRYAGRLMTAGYSSNRAKKRSGVDARKEVVEKLTE